MTKDAQGGQGKFPVVWGQWHWGPTQICTGRLHVKWQVGRVAITMALQRAGRMGVCSCIDLRMAELCPTFPTSPLEHLRRQYSGVHGGRRGGRWQVVGFAGAKLRVGSPSRLIDKCLGPSPWPHLAQHPAGRPSDRAGALLPLPLPLLRGTYRPSSAKRFSDPDAHKKNWWWWWRRTTTSYTVDQLPALTTDDSQ